MSKLISMIRKELLEMLRSYKLFLLPVVFMLLGAMQPIMYYYLPDILSMSTLPEGAILQIPLPTPNETMIGVISQFNQLGLLILVLITMGAIANEVKSGVAETILVKPVSIKSYLFAKWVAYFSITVLSIFVGILLGHFYTIQLIGEIAFLQVMQATLIFLLYILFFVGLTLLLSAVFTSNITVGGIVISLAIFSGILANFGFNYWFLPTKLIMHYNNILLGISADMLWLSISITIVYITAMFVGSVAIFKRKQI